MNKMPFLQISSNPWHSRLAKGWSFAFLFALHLFLGNTVQAQARFDAGLVNLALPIPFTAGTHPISVTLYNASDTTTLRTARIAWSVNGVAQPERHWTGALLPQKDTVLTLGEATLVFDPDNTIQTAILEANGQADDDNGNDAILRSGIRASYAGTLRVGGLNPDFATVGELAANLSARGVAGPLEVRIRPGRYEEAVAFTNIPYSTPQRPITFQRDPAFSGTVTLASPQAGAAWAFSIGVLNLFFKNLHFESGLQSQQYGLYATMLSDKPFGVDTLGFSVDSCVFVGTAPAGESNTGLYLNTIGGIDRISVQHCHFENLNEPAVLTAADGLLRFDENEGKHCGAPMIFFTRGSANFSRNIFSAAPNNPNAQPLILSLPAVDAVFEANQIRASGNQIATFAAGAQQNGETLRVYNNFFYNESGLKGVGVNLEGSDIRFDFNSIRSKTGLALETNLSGAFSIRNNIISETHATGTAFRVNQTPYYPIDYNCYHATSGRLFNFAGTAVNTLVQWQTLLHRDSNSLAVDPGFYLAGSFQVKRAALDGAAVPIAGIVTDLEGRPRDPQKSDIGASEFDPYPLDAAVAAITAPVFPFGKGLQAIRVRLLNDATAPLQSVRFQVRVNGAALPDYEWTGLLAPDSTVEVSVGDFDFADFTPYVLEVTAQSANGVPEYYVQNDTIRSAPRFTALSGIYEVGAGQTLASPQAAASALATYGVFSPVRFRLASGNYEGGLVLDSLTGNPTTVAFESATGQANDVRCQILGDTGIWLRGTDGVTFYGITFENQAKTATACIRLTGEVKGLRIDSCFFDLGFADAANQRAALVANNAQFSQPPAWLIEEVSIRRSWFKGGASGIVLNPRYVKNLLVEENRFEEQSQLGIQMAGYQVPGSAQCLIRHNVFESSDSARYYNGLSVFISVGVYSIDSTLAGTEVSRNNIRHDRGSAIAVVSPIGGAFMAYTNAVVINNFIFTDPIDKGSGGPLVGSMGLGGRKIKVFYNTVRSTSERPCIFFSDMEQVEVRNNLFARENPQGVMFQSVNPGALSADYNNYHTPGLVLFDIKPFLGFYANWDYWQSIFQQDKHSLRVNPKFTLPDDYHIEQDSLNGKALPLAGVTVDLDGDVRDPQTPDIGADESVLVGLSNVADAAVSIAPTLVHSSISIQTLGTALESVAVFDARGRTVWRQGRPQAEQCQIDASDWLPGIYVVRVQMADGRVATRKVVRASRSY